MRIMNAHDPSSLAGNSGAGGAGDPTHSVGVGPACGAMDLPQLQPEKLQFYPSSYTLRMHKSLFLIKTLHF